MQRRMMWLLAVLAAVGCLSSQGCVVVPPRSRVVAVAPVRVWVPAHWGYGHVWVGAHWQYR